MADHPKIAIPLLNIAELTTLLKSIPDFNISDIFIHKKKNSEHETTLAFHAVETKNKELLDYLINLNVDLSVDIPNKGTVLHGAVLCRDLGLVKKLHKAGSNINVQRNNDLATPLVIAVMENYFEIAKYLIDNGADVHAEARLDDNCGHTPILIATNKGNKNIVKLLIKNGADPCAEITKRDLSVAGIKNILSTSPNITINSIFILKNENCRPCTLAHLAVKYKKKELLNYLISTEADLNINIPLIGTVLLQATKTGIIKLVKKLCESGADPNNVQMGCETALIVAARENFLEIAKFLIAKRADVNAQVTVSPYKGETALYFAVCYGYKDMAKLLLKNNADPMMRMDLGWTTIAEACIQSHFDIMKMIAFYSKIYDDDTILHVLCIAASRKGEKVIEFLLELDIDAFDNLLKEEKLEDSVLHNVLGGFCKNQRYCARGNEPNIRVILDAGVNINSINFFFKDALTRKDICKPEVLNCMKCHIVRLKQAGFYICQENAEAVEEEYDYLSVECQQEIRKLKSDNVGTSNLVFYEVLHKNIHSMAISLSHTYIDDIADKKRLLTKYPIYGGMIYYKLVKVQRRIKLLKEVDEFSDYVLNYCLKLPYTFTRELYFYLTNDNLKKLTQYKDSC